MTKAGTYICMAIILALIIVAVVFLFQNNYYNADLTGSATLV